MLIEVFSLYLQGLVAAVVVVCLLLAIWMLFRVLKRKDKTAVERQAALYDAFLIAIITIPILSFAFMAVILMLKA
ncbi:MULTISPECIES: DUF4059 family protein [Streptococcus]|uniref:DUF4059 family protein n=1 Tax=Streptococcus zalophi TaxID=640031 RepID=A0A934P956_9STRE|nr:MULTISPECIES: DUF4059 family protein [Streptococcus]MBJ8349222.1 DUF4059 family protein [Streptococcus zalophi]MCR8967155.1 DUF4059 family protein [Streptococcus zalophi]MCU9532960.1 DUF4059 family protein [Streptococcus sp. CSL10205-OR2]